MVHASIVDQIRKAHGDERSDHANLRTVNVTPAP